MAIPSSTLTDGAGCLPVIRYKCEVSSVGLRSPTTSVHASPLEMSDQLELLESTSGTESLVYLPIILGGEVDVVSVA